MCALLKNGQQYAARGQQEYEEQCRRRQLGQLAKKAEQPGYELKQKDERPAMSQA